MRKAELLSLPDLKPTKEIIETAKNDIPEMESGWGRRRESYKYNEYYRAKVFGDILKVAIFSREDLIREKATYEIYISKKENKYMSYNTLEEKWKTAKIDRLTRYYYYGTDKRFYSRGTEKAITKYLKNGYERGYEAIYQFQQAIGEENLRRAHRKITERIDSVMELVPPLPKDFGKFCEEIAMIKSRYIYYTYSRNVKEGYCTHCKKTVTIEKPKHNTEGTCSSCKSKIIFKAIKKAATVQDKGYATILQKTREGFIQRYFELRKIYRDYKIPEYYYAESIRTFYDKNFRENGKYEWADFKNAGEIRWCDWNNKAYSYGYYQREIGCEYESNLYTRNLTRVLKDTEFQYSAIEIFAKKIVPSRFQPKDYFSEYRRNKGLEYLVKLGLYNIAKATIKGYDNSVINRYGKRIHEMLKVQKEQEQMIIKMNPTTDEIRVLQKANAAGVKVTPEQIKWIAENIGRNDLIGYMKYNTAHRVIRYLKENSSKKKLVNVASDYYDYLECCEKLGYELENEFILFPKNLKQSHDLAVDEWQQEKDRIDGLETGERNQLLGHIAEEQVKKYAMEDKHFKIIIPWTVEEIKAEGHKLHHCVGNYIDRVLRKETEILFIREKGNINVPFYTMEIRRNEVVQCRGKNNGDMTKEVRRFVEKFKSKKLEKSIERIAS